MKTGALRTCSNCGNEFRGRVGAAYCGASCRQRARRARGKSIRDKCDTRRVTLTPARRAPAHAEEAAAVLAELDAESASNAEQIGKQLERSAAERAVRELIADTIDRRGDLQRMYEATKDASIMVKLVTELRLTEQSLARLLNSVKTDLPEPFAEIAEGAAGS
jgi:hypothetical protein